jgi:hypothetical protein
MLVICRQGTVTRATRDTPFSGTRYADAIEGEPQSRKSYGSPSFTTPLPGGHLSLSGFGNLKIIENNHPWRGCFNLPGSGF